MKKQKKDDSNRLLRRGIDWRFSDMMIDFMCKDHDQDVFAPYICGWLSALQEIGAISDSDFQRMYEELCREWHPEEWED